MISDSSRSMLRYRQERFQWFKSFTASLFTGSSRFQSFQTFHRFAPFQSFSVVQRSTVQSFNEREELPCFENSRKVEMIVIQFSCSVNHRQRIEPFQSSQ